MIGALSSSFLSDRTPTIPHAKRNVPLLEAFIFDLRKGFDLSSPMRIIGVDLLNLTGVEYACYEAVQMIEFFGRTVRSLARKAYRIIML